MKHLALVLAIAIMLSGCTGVVSNEQQITNQGNTAGNIVNLGFVAQQGDWLYYNTHNGEDFSLWKKKYP